MTDRSTTPAFNNGFEFKDGIDLPTEYEYDENGNLTKDLNKNITAIQYNCLNLPGRVMFANGNSISYLYDAAGRKLPYRARSGRRQCYNGLLRQCGL